MNNFTIKKVNLTLDSAFLSESKLNILDFTPNTISNSIFRKYDNSLIDVDINDNMITFDGTKNKGLIFEDTILSNDMININKASYYLTFDFNVTSISTDKMQTMFICMENQTSYFNPSFLIQVCPEKNWFAVIFYNTYQSIYSCYNGFYKIELNKTYNLKFLVLPNNNFGLYINNKLISKGNTKTRSDRGSGSGVTNSTNYKYFFGMNQINKINSYYKGKINNFKFYQIGSDDTNIFDTTTYASNRLVYIPFDYNAVNGSTGYYYNDECIKNLGTYNLNLSYKSNTTYENALKSNLGGEYISWFKTSSSNVISFTNNVFKNLNKYSISLRIKTGATLEDGALIDTRTASGNYNGFLITLPAADPSMVRLYLSDESNTTAWFKILSSGTGLIKENSEHLITMIHNEGKFELYVDGNKVDETTENHVLNITSSNIFFGCNASSSAVFNGHIRDISIYNEPILPLIDNDYNEFNINYEPPKTYNFIEDEYKYFRNLKKTSTIVYDESGNNTMYTTEDTFTKINYFIEGSDSNDDIELYYNGKLFIKKKDNIQYNYIKKNKLQNYNIKVNNEFKQLLNLSEYRGEIRGFVNVSNCGADAKDLSILCYSSNDHRFIGDFEIVNGTYVIPNLDALLKYDIVLVDKSRTIEQKVLSYRTPEPYSNQFIEPNTFNINYFNSNVNISWKRKGYYDIYIFKSTVPDFEIDIENPYHIIKDNKNIYTDSNGLEYGQTYYYICMYYNKNNEPVISDHLQITILDKVNLNLISYIDDSLTVKIHNTSIYKNDFINKLYFVDSDTIIDINSLPSDFVEIENSDNIIINKKMYGSYNIILESEYLGYKSYSNIVYVNNNEENFGRFYLSNYSDSSIENGENKLIVLRSNK